MRYKRVEILSEQMTVPSVRLVFPDCLHYLNTGQNNLDIIATKKHWRTDIHNRIVIGHRMEHKDNSSLYYRVWTGGLNEVRDCVAVRGLLAGEGGEPGCTVSSLHT